MLFTLVAGCSKKGKAAAQTQLQPEVLSAADKERGLVTFVDVVENFKRWKSKDFKVRAIYAAHVPIKLLVQNTKTFSGEILFAGKGTEATLSFNVDGLALSDVPEDLTMGETVILTIQVDNKGKFKVKKISDR
jgi:hypothetical protein